VVTDMTQIKDLSVITLIAFDRLLLVIVEGRGLGAIVNCKFTDRQNYHSPPDALSDGTTKPADTPGKWGRCRGLSCVSDYTTLRRQVQGAS